MQDEYDGDVIFLAVVREDDSGDAATPTFAETYSNRYDFDNFPAVADVGNEWYPFMGSGYPTNVIIDLRTMEYLYTRAGLMTATEIRSKIVQYQ